MPGNTQESAAKKTTDKSCSTPTAITSSEKQADAALRSQCSRRNIAMAERSRATGNSEKTHGRRSQNAVIQKLFPDRFNNGHNHAWGLINQKRFSISWKCATCFGARRLMLVKSQHPYSVPPIHSSVRRSIISSPFGRCDSASCNVVSVNPAAPSVLCYFSWRCIHSWPVGCCVVLLAVRGDGC